MSFTPGLARFAPAGATRTARTPTRTPSARTAFSTQFAAAANGNTPAPTAPPSFVPPTQVRAKTSSQDDRRSAETASTGSATPASTGAPTTPNPYAGLRDWLGNPIPHPDTPVDMGPGSSFDPARRVIPLCVLAREQFDYTGPLGRDV